MILLAIYYVIYWKNRKNLRGFDYRSDIAIHERGGTISSRNGKISLVERKTRTSKTFAGTQEQLLIRNREESSNFTLREQDCDQKSVGERSSSH